MYKVDSHFAARFYEENFENASFESRQDETTATALHSNSLIES